LVFYHPKNLYKMLKGGAANILQPSKQWW